MSKEDILNTLSIFYIEQKEEILQDFQGREVLYDHKDHVWEYTAEELFNATNPASEQENTIREHWYLRGIEDAIRIVKRKV